MARRSLTGFIFLNIVVTFLVTSGIILVSDRLRPPAPTPARDLLQVIITATPDPNQTPLVRVVVVTATPLGQASTGIAILPTPGPGTALPTFDPSLLPPALGPAQASTPVPTDPSGCPTYRIREGDILVRIATVYGVTLASLMKANNLTEYDATRLQIGQVIIIPVDGCGLPTDTPQPTLTPTFSPTPPPTSTDVPTPSAALLGAPIEVVQIISPGDITQEGIEIRNISGSEIDIGGWTIRDTQGNTFTFPDYRMFGNRRVIVYTRSGANTPLALFWGLSQAIWSTPGQQITIADTKGKIQVTYSLAENPTPDSSRGVVPTPTP